MNPLTTIGLCWLAGWLLGDAVRGMAETRRVGRRVLRVVGTLMRPLRRHHVRRDRAARCARRGHRTTWDGYHETCHDCGAIHELVPVGSRYVWCWIPPNDPAARPGPLKLRVDVDVDDATVRELIAKFEAQHARRRP